MTTAGYSDPWLLYGVGRHQGIKLTEAVDDGTSVEADSEFAIVGIDIRDIADVAVIDLLVVVVLDLHDLVAGREDPAESLDLTFAGRIQSRLQFDVERTRTNPAPIHWAQHLDIPDGIKAESTRDAGFHQVDNAGNCGFNIIRLDKIEVTLALWFTQIGKNALVDPVSIHDDLALSRLTEHFGQAHHRQHPTRDHVGEHLAGTDRRQLVDIPDHQKGRRVRHRLKQRMHQQHIDHGRFVHDEQVAVEGVLAIPPKPAGPGIDFEQPVDGLGLEAGGLVHARGRTAGGSAHQ